MNERLIENSKLKAQNEKAKKKARRETFNAILNNSENIGTTRHFVLR